MRPGRDGPAAPLGAAPAPDPDPAASVPATADGPNALPLPAMVPAPTGTGGRVDALDVVRGVALIGVLLVNLCTEFRVSLFDWLLAPAAGPRGPWSDAVLLGLSTFVEMKAFAMFSLLFGVGVAVQAERRGPALRPFLKRRLGALLALGVLHGTLVWDGDILAEYAVVAALLVPLLALPDALLLLAGVGLLGVNALGYPRVGTLPGPEHLAAAAAAYGHGTWLEALRFRWIEIGYILPLHVELMPRTLGLMALGAWSWRAGAWRPSGRPFVAGVLVVALPVGVLLSVWRAASSVWLGPVVDALATVASALGYAAAAALSADRLAFLAPLGRMALTNYLAQSLLWSWVFYGWGLGWYGRMDMATALGLGLGLYAVQIALSAAWLRVFAFGPVEWAWRCVSYARWLPIRSRDGPAAG